MTGYSVLVKGDASLALSGWFATIRAAGLVVENNRAWRVALEILGKYLRLRIPNEAMEKSLSI
jgi:hypothetical protein